MALTIEQQMSEAPTPTPPRTPRRGRVALAWGAGVAALAATTMLVIAVATPDATTPARNLHLDVGDAKDHPQYNPPATSGRNLHVDVGDAKDHPQYNPPDNATTPNRNLHVDVGDAKDHPQYNPPDNAT